MSLPTTLLAGACEIAGRTDEAATLLDEAFQIVQRTGERWFAAELYRHKASCCWRQGHEEAAAGLYRNALSIAREKKAKLWELRAAISFARLRHDQRRHAEAQDLLAPIYVWFTEGFDTRDLKGAKTLLDCIETAPAVSVSNASRSDAGTSARVDLGNRSPSRLSTESAAKTSGYSSLVNRRRRSSIAP